ncbi:unnamed protein product, partial [Mesorhabditis belari]|uniref:C-type lectin domain-containing protein n=1 Tax=Mesorhabditis belari TaxID=2138241 RepID=A0AAF3J3W6_9BILA
MGVMAVHLFITILLLFHQISSSIQQSEQLDQFTSPNDRDEILSRDRRTLKRTQNTEARDGKAKIGELERKINASQTENSDFETQIDRTMTFLDLYRDGWSYLAKTASWYKVIEQGMSFDKAEAHCASRRSHLVSIHSQEEHDFVWTLAGTVDSSRSYQIGMKRDPNEGNTFEWTDGSSVDFTNWAVGEPDSNTHAYVRFSA